MNLISLFVASVLSQNIVLSKFLGYVLLSEHLKIQKSL
jgi:Na+-transporting NADH:ubiquinone oxidoreductase subunit NqrE